MLRCLYYLDLIQFPRGWGSSRMFLCINSAKLERFTKMTIRRAIAYTFTTNALFLASLQYSFSQAPTTGTQTYTTQADHAVYVQAMKAMKESRYPEARTLLEGLITSYPDSSYVARAKLSIADAWYAEGRFKRALIEYQDFITFFPNRPEVGEAKLKIDAIQKRQSLGEKSR